MDLILATENSTKTEQVREIFEGSRFAVKNLEELRIYWKPDEKGRTLAANASRKALFVHHFFPDHWKLGDDSGIFIDALGGKPGVRSKRWAGEGATTEEITRHTLKELEGVRNRSATFKTVVALVSPEGNPRYFFGEITGTLLEAPRVPPRPEMPYSSIFVPDGHTQVLAEMTITFENKISHRGKAFRQARKFLEAEVK